MAKRKNKKNKNKQRSYTPASYSYCDSKDINQIAVKVFGSSYFTLIKQNK